jgi:hypothetical protein
MCGTGLIFLYFSLRCDKFYVTEIVGKIFGTENIRIKGNSNEQVKLCDKDVLTDSKIR